MMDFTPSQLNAMVSTVVKPGEVYRMKFTADEGIVPKNEGDTSRNKYFIVIGISRKGDIIGCVLINTQVNQHLPPRVRNSHYRLLAADYPFLVQDRFAFCADLKQIASRVFFERFQGGAVDLIRREHLDAMKGIMAASANIDAHTLREFGII